MKQIKLSEINNLETIFEDVVSFNKPVKLSSNKGNFIVLSEQQYRSIVDTIYLLSQNDLIKNIKCGEKENFDLMSIYNESESW